MCKSTASDKRFTDINLDDDWAEYDDDGDESVAIYEFKSRFETD